MLDRIRFQAALGFCLFLLSACGDGGGGGSGSGTATQIVVTPQQGNLVVGEMRSFSAVAITSTGKEIENVSFSWQSLDPTIASVDGNGTVTGNAIGVATIAVTGTYRTGSFTRTVSGTTAVGVISPNPGGTNLTISGTASYEDRPFDITGFTGETEQKPIRGAIIEVIAIKGFQTLATAATGIDGMFTIPNVNNTTGNAGLYLRVLAKTDPNNPTKVEIRNNLSEGDLLSTISSAIDDSNGNGNTFDKDVAAMVSGIGGAFNILDIFSTASELIQQSGACTPAVDPCVPPLLTAYWEPGSAEGTYYNDDPEVDAIFILGGGDSEGDHDEYDDSVIAHEYGHFIVHHFSKDDSPGGEHFITDNSQDIRLSWSEGWGNFFSSAVRNSPVYLDTSTGGSFSFNLEDYSTSPAPSTLKSVAIYTTSEIAVTGVLWDLFDDPSTLLSIFEQHDQIGLGFEPIWQTVLSFSDTTPAAMESFWLQFASLYPGSAAGLQSIMTERQMELFADSTETGETELVANSSSQHHTLYQASPSQPQNDEDVIPFSVTSGKKYRLETFNLTNGADTLLTITELGLQSDNWNGRNYSQDCGVNLLTGNSTCPLNDKKTLSSSITWKAGSDTTLHAHVKRSPNAPPSAGQFGSYDIQLKIVP